MPKRELLLYEPEVLSMTSSYQSSNFCRNFSKSLPASVRLFCKKVFKLPSFMLPTVVCKDLTSVPSNRCIKMLAKVLAFIYDGFCCDSP